MYNNKKLFCIELCQKVKFFHIAYQSCKRSKFIFLLWTGTTFITVFTSNSWTKSQLNIAKIVLMSVFYISQTQLYQRVKLFFCNYQVLRIMPNLCCKWYKHQRALLVQMHNSQHVSVTIPMQHYTQHNCTIISM